MTSLAEQNLTEVDLSHFRRLLAAVCGESVSISWSTEPSASTGECVFPAGSLRTGAYAMPVEDTLGDLIGYMRVEIHGDKPAYDDVAAQKLLHWIVEGIQRDYELNREIDGMAEDISYRYEELNLVYALDELSSQIVEFQGDNVFDHISATCLRYLTVDAVFCHIPDFGGKGPAIKNAQKNKHKEKTSIELAGYLMRQLRHDSRTLVCNYASDTFWDNSGLTSSARFIGAPIWDVGDQILGVLLIIKGFDTLEYTNGDRKLAELLASHASHALVSHQDSVTGLYNQKGFELVSNERIRENQSCSKNWNLVLVEIDNFSELNDTLGTKGGIELTRFIGHLIKSNLSERVLSGCFSNSEFGLLVEAGEVAELAHAISELQKIITAARFDWDDIQVDPTISAGVALIPDSAYEFSHILGHARIATKIARENGKSGLYIPQKLDPAIVSYKERIDYIGDVISALENDRLHLFLQPIVEVSVGQGRVFRYEVLLRVEDKNGKIGLPNRLISAAEQFEIMPKVDQWVVHNALSWLAQCEDESIRFAINLSGQSLNQAFSQFLESELNSFAIEPSRICFEITETAVVSNLNEAINLLKKLRVRGCRTSLDDFGSGLSSFSYLQTMPVDYLKIDGSFVKDIVGNSVSHAMVDAINRVGLAMNLCTVAEFVENAEVLGAIRQIGVHYAQGYGVGRPQPIEDVLAQRRVGGAGAGAG